jgi:hypothetical protein
MWVETLRYLTFAAVALLGPGVALQRLARVRLEPALVLPIGAVLTATAYWLSLVTGHPAIFPALIALGNLPLLLRRPLAAAEPDPGPDLRHALPAIGVTVLLLAVTQYPLNRVAATGEFLLDPVVTFDTAFHVGLTRELTLGYPPQVPGLSGFPLGYHLGLDLVRAAALQWASVDPYDAISRFDVTLWAVALILALRAATHRLGAPRLAVQLAGFAPLAGDFSFIFAGNPQAHWWTDLLRGNLLFSVAFANPVVPALALALGVLIALARYEKGPTGWLLLAGAQALAVAFFKVFLGAQLALGLGVAALLYRERWRAYALTAGLAGAATALLALGEGARTVDVSLAPLDLARITRETLLLPPAKGWTLAGWTLLWLAASLGLRWIGVGPAIRALRPRGAAGPAVVLAVMALCAWPIGLMFRVAPLDAVAGQKPINDVAYLVEQGGLLLWVFAATAIARAATRWGPAPVLAAVVCLTLPATAQFAVKKAFSRPDAIPAGAVRGMRALAAASRPGEVVMQRPGMRFPAPPLVLVGRRVPYERFTPYLTQFAAKPALEQRHEAVYRFFHTEDGAEAATIASDLHARYLCLYGADRVHFDLAARYEPLYEDAEARVYRRKEE